VQRPKDKEVQQLSVPNRQTLMLKLLIQSGWMMEKMMKLKVRKIKTTTTMKWPVYILFSSRGIYDPRQRNSMMKYRYAVKDSKKLPD